MLALVYQTLVRNSFSTVCVPVGGGKQPLNGDSLSKTATAQRPWLSLLVTALGPHSGSFLRTVIFQLNSRIASRGALLGGPTPLAATLDDPSDLPLGPPIPSPSPLLSHWSGLSSPPWIGGNF